MSSKSSQNEIIYEYCYENCQGKVLHEIGKWLQGKDSQFWVQYMHKVNELDPDERKLWMHIIGQSEVTKEGPK